MNTVKLKGNATAEPRISPTKSEDGVVAFVTIAVNRPNLRRPDYVSVVAFGDEALKINDRVTTGTELEVIGHVSSSRQYGLQVVVDFVQVGNGALAVA